MTRLDLLKALAGDDELDLSYRGHTVKVRGNGADGEHYVTVDDDHEFGEIGDYAYDRIAVIKFIDDLIDILDDEPRAGLEYAGLNPDLSAWAMLRINWEERTIIWFNSNRGVHTDHGSPLVTETTVRYTPDELLNLIKKEG